ncbi:MAG TPA: ABC transporter ATP-binding protein [Devosia sp.]|nr:ABC transporter ATP-binding protein [Devosia sp.]
MIADFALAIENLSVSIDNGSGPIQLVSDVTLSVARGECLGVVGESGCGKTVTFLAALGLLPGRAQVHGSVRIGGEELLGRREDELERVRGQKIGLIFQDPQSALNPVRTIGRQLMEPLRTQKRMDRQAAQRRAIELLRLVGIPGPEERLSAYPHQLSGGMCQRIMIAMALAAEPDVLIADEPTTALDATVQLQILDLLKSIQKQTGLALVFITHDLGVVARMCDRVTVMYAGRTVETHALPEAFAAPFHPYTEALIGCLPALDFDGEPAVSIPGEVPIPGQLPSGCAFHPRCSRATDLCIVQTPAAGSPAPAATVACHHPLLHEELAG